MNDQRYFTLIWHAVYSDERRVKYTASFRTEDDAMKAFRMLVDGGQEAAFWKDAIYTNTDTCFRARTADERHCTIQLVTVDYDNPDSSLKNTGPLAFSPGSVHCTDKAFPGRFYIPAVYRGAPVMAIEDNGFRGCDRALGFILPASIRTIGKHAFEGCSNVSILGIPYGVRRIEQGAFKNCRNLSVVRIPDTVEYIGPDAFKGCLNLQTVILPAKKLETIEKGTFENCKRLTSLRIPACVKKVKSGAFKGCDALENIHAESEATKFAFTAK